MTPSPAWPKTSAASPSKATLVSVVRFGQRKENPRTQPASTSRRMQGHGLPLIRRAEHGQRPNILRGVGDRCARGGQRYAAGAISLPVSIIEVMAALVDHASEPLWLEAQYNACQIVVGGKLVEPGIDGALRSLGGQLSCMLFLMYQLGIVGILLSGGAY